ncbi:MAG: hypothetical protein NZL83_04255 [Candidatus Absconditabacterales bacterium]|nr:hypothetical protein [Candidatus Absconditabacterales bacterium]
MFGNPENNLDFRDTMNSGNIILITLSKGERQEEIVAFLGAMFVTKMYQTAMGR